MEIKGGDFRVNQRPLKNVRPFKMGEIVLSELEDLDPNDVKIEERMTDVLKEKVYNLIEEARHERSQLLEKEKQREWREAKKAS